MNRRSKGAIDLATTVQDWLKEIANCEAVLDGKTVNGVKLGDTGVEKDWLESHIAAVRREMLKVKLKPHDCVFGAFDNVVGCAICGQPEAD